MSKKSKKLKTFRVEGGLGKHIVFTSLLKPLYEKYGKINMISPYNDVFDNNKYVEHSWGSEEFDMNSKELKKYVSDIEFYEPYKTGFAFRNEHIKDMWGDAFGVKAENKPSFEANKETKEQVKEILKAIGDKYFVVQFSGGQPPIGFDQQNIYQHNPMQLARNYPYQMSHILVQKLKAKYPDYKVIDFTLPNEPTIDGTERFALPYLGYKEICKNAKDIVCIDSALAHIAAATEKSAIVLWNDKAEATPTKYGWYMHENITSKDMIIDYDYIVNKIIERNSGNATDILQS